MRRVLLLLLLAYGCTNANAQEAPGSPPTNWGFLETNEHPSVQNEYAPDGFGAREASIIFDFNPELWGNINTSLPGYGFSRTSTATTITESGGVYTVVKGVAANIPRYVEHPTLGNGYWSEEAGTNITPRSETFDVGWTNRNSSESVDGAVAPDGTMTADGSIANTSNVSHGFELSTSSAATTHTQSVFVKKGDVDWAYLGDSTGGTVAYFNIDTGVKGSSVGSPDDYDIVGYGNGWYRIWITATWAANSTIRVWSAEADNDTAFAGDDSTVNTWFWGGQLEANAYVTSYIPTTTSSATRAVDSLFYDLDNQQSGSLITETTPSEFGANAGTACLYHGGDDRILVYYLSDAKPATFSADGAATQWNFFDATPATVNTRHTISLSFETNDIEAWHAGSSIGTDVSANIEAQWDQMYIANQNGSVVMNGVVHRVRFETKKDVIQ